MTYDDYAMLPAMVALFTAFVVLLAAIKYGAGSTERERRKKRDAKIEEGRQRVAEMEARFQSARDAKRAPPWRSSPNLETGLHVAERVASGKPVNAWELCARYKQYRYHCRHCGLVTHRDDPARRFCPRCGGDIASDWRYENIDRQPSAYLPFYANH